MFYMLLKGATNSSFAIADLQRITMFRKNFLVLLHKLVFRIFTHRERKFLL